MKLSVHDAWAHAESVSLHMLKDPENPIGYDVQLRPLDDNFQGLSDSRPWIVATQRSGVGDTESFLSEPFSYGKALLAYRQAVRGYGKLGLLPDDDGTVCGKSNYYAYRQHLKAELLATLPNWQGYGRMLEDTFEYFQDAYKMSAFCSSIRSLVAFSDIAYGCVEGLEDARYKCGQGPSAEQLSSLMSSEMRRWLRTYALKSTDTITGVDAVHGTCDELKALPSHPTYAHLLVSRLKSLSYF